MKVLIIAVASEVKLGTVLNGSQESRKCHECPSSGAPPAHKSGGQGRGTCDVTHLAARLLCCKRQHTREDTQEIVSDCAVAAQPIPDQYDLSLAGSLPLPTLHPPPEHPGREDRQRTGTYLQTRLLAAHTDSSIAVVSVLSATNTAIPTSRLVRAIEARCCKTRPRAQQHFCPGRLCEVGQDQETARQEEGRVREEWRVELEPLASRSRFTDFQPSSIPPVLPFELRSWRWSPPLARHYWSPVPITGLVRETTALLAPERLGPLLCGMAAQLPARTAG